MQYNGVKEPDNEITGITDAGFLPKHHNKLTINQFNQFSYRFLSKYQDDSLFLKIPFYTYKNIPYEKPQPI